MIKKELVKALSKDVGISVTNEEVKLILDSIFKTLKEESEKGTSVTLSKVIKIKTKRSPSWSEQTVDDEVIEVFSEEEIRQREWDRFIES